MLVRPIRVAGEALVVHRQDVKIELPVVVDSGSEARHFFRMTGTFFLPFCESRPRWAPAFPDYGAASGATTWGPLSNAFVSFRTTSSR
jgi:hypothetical protein